MGGRSKWRPSASSPAPSLPPPPPPPPGPRSPPPKQAAGGRRGSWCCARACGRAWKTDHWRCERQRLMPPRRWCGRRAEKRCLHGWAMGWTPVGFDALMASSPPRPLNRRSPRYNFSNNFQKNSLAMIRFSLVLAFFACSTSAFMPTLFSPKSLSSVSFKSAGSRRVGLRGGSDIKMAEITPNVKFDTIAREWRCKWSADADKHSLVEAQNALESVLKEVKSVKGVKSVQRVVCGGCLDFKVVTALSADVWGDWEAKKFAPEEAFLSKLKAIKGISQVETQTYTLMPL